MKRTQAQAGFTLAEFAVSVGVAMLVMAATLVTANTLLPSWRVQEASSSMATALRAARARAMLEGSDVVMPIDMQRNRYTVVTRGAAGSLSTDLLMNGTKLTIVTLPSGVRFVRPDAGDTVTLKDPAQSQLIHARQAVFNERGWLESQATPAHVYVGDKHRGVYRRIEVNLVGNVKVERWNGRNWE